MEKKNEKDVLIVRDEKTGEVSVVAGLNADGTPKRVAAKAEHTQDFMRFDRNSDAIDSFFRNFYRQCKEPTRFGFYRVAVEQAERLVGVMKELLKDPEGNAELLKAHKVDTSKYALEVESEERRVKNSRANESDDAGINSRVQPRMGEANSNVAEGDTNAASINRLNNKEMEEKKISNESEKNVQDVQVTNKQSGDVAAGEKKTLIDATAVDWQDIKTKYGVDFETMSEADKKALLNYGKTGLLTVKPTLGGETIEIQARLSFKKDADGTIKLVPHFVRNEPRLDVAYKGYTFTEEDKKNLKMNGNLGKVVNLTDSSGETRASFISVDRLTKEITDIAANKVRVPERIGKTAITADDKKILLAGLPLRKEIELADGRKFSPLLQVNVEQRGVEFVPNSRSQAKSEKREVKNSNDVASDGDTKQQKSERKEHWLNADGSIRKLATYFKIPLTEKQQEDYAAGKAIEICNVPEKNGSGTYTAYVKFDMDARRPKAYRENPDFALAVEKIPTNENKTQVAVNEQGKTNEATKNIKKPLKPGQDAPKNAQQAKEQKAPTEKKGKGMKV